MKRAPTQAGFFYPASESACREILAKYLSNHDTPVSEHIIAGIVPHAGWTFSGATAGKVYQAIAQQGSPETFIIFGAVHVGGVFRASIWKEGSWKTPLGEIEVDSALVQKIFEVGGNFIEDNPEVHLSEHSIEVQLPFIQYLFPNTKIVPIMVAPFPEANKIGEIIASVVSKDSKIVALASTDMTHYGTRYGFIPQGVGEKALKWVKEVNDKRMIELFLKLEDKQVVKEAMSHHNACGSGAVAATLAYAKKLGKQKGTLLHYTTSFDVYPERTIDCFVGYAGVVF